MSDRISIFLIDDHSMVRAGIRAIIERNEKYRVVGEAGNGKEALELCSGLKPRIIILDIDLPDMSGLNLIQKLKAMLPASEIMMLSMYYQQNYINKALSEGAKAYVIKESGQEKLLKALAALEEGDIYIDGNTAASGQDLSERNNGSEEHLRDEAYESLTGREQEIMLLLAEGWSVKDIAAKTYISARTVENHRSSIFRKLGLQNLIELVRYAARLGLIDLDTWK